MINLGGIKLQEQLIHGERLIVARLKDGFDLCAPYSMVKRMQELHGSVMVIVWQHGHISPHVVHNHGEALKPGVNRVTGYMSEILIHHMVSRKQASLHLIVPTMSYLEPLPNLTSQIL
jgi:hypothetical protein